MDLPTYTNIWRIEKRLYKLYDLRLPMPLPLGQIAAFVGITVPYVLLLALIGVPFTHTLFWLYVLPPGLLTWLVTRPVIENKKLPELLVSQVRYLGEPNVWCRMAPSTEKDEIIVVGRVWHACQQAAPLVSTVERRRLVQARAHAAGQPTWAAPAPGSQGRPAEPQHRKPAAGRPQPAMTAVGQAATAGQAAVRNGQAAAGFAPQRARTGPRPVPAPRAMPHGPEAPERAVATWPQHRGPGPVPPRPAPPAPGRVQQPEWALRARPGGPLGKPVSTSRPRFIEVAHTEDNQPARWPTAGGLRPVRGIADAQPGRVSAGARQPVGEPKLPAAGAGRAHPVGQVPVRGIADAQSGRVSPGAPQPVGEPTLPAAGAGRAHPVGPVPAVRPSAGAAEPSAGAVKPPAVAPADGRTRTAPGLPQPDPPAAGIAHADRAGPVPLVRPTRAAVPGSQPSGAARDTRPPDDRPGVQGTGQPAAGRSRWGS